MTSDSASDPLADCPTAYGPPPLRGILRAVPEDFFVAEIPLMEPDGAGQHLLVQVRKRGRTTEEAAAALAREAGVPRRAVSFAGLKDRHAVTEQWFSLDVGGRAEVSLSGDPGAGLEVLAQHRHGRKLRRGALAGNAFRLRLREVQGERDALEQRLAVIRTHGVPNYFGPQRFGRGGGNVSRAQAMFAGKLRPRRALRGMLLSAARAELFNRVLAARVRDGDWCEAVAGDVLQWQGRNSRFAWAGEDAQRVQGLVAAGELHPTGPLWGRGARDTGENIRRREDVAIADAEELAAGLEQAGLEPDRRPLRLSVAGLTASWPEATTLELAFSLPPGSYATTVVRELVAS